MQTRRSILCQDAINIKCRIIKIEQWKKRNKDCTHAHAKYSEQFIKSRNDASAVAKTRTHHWSRCGLHEHRHWLQVCIGFDRPGQAKEWIQSRTFALSSEDWRGETTVTLSDWRGETTVTLSDWRAQKKNGRGVRRVQEANTSTFALVLIDCSAESAVLREFVLQGI